MGKVPAVLPLMLAELLVVNDASRLEHVVGGERDLIQHRLSGEGLHTDG